MAPTRHYGLGKQSRRVLSPWYFEADSGGIPAGQAVSGFGFSSHYLPGIGLFYAKGHHTRPAFPEGMAEDSIPGYDDLTPYGPGIIGSTIVPVLLGANASNFALLDSLNSYITHSFSLGWIANQAVADRYSGLVNRSRTHLVVDLDPRQAVRTLDSALTMIPLDSLQGTLTTDACALLRLNMGCLKSELAP